MADELEKILIRKAKQGNMTAFEKLILQHEKTVYNIAYRMFHNEEDAKDMSQEVFIKVFRWIEKFDENAAFSTWLYRIAVNTCIDEIRKRKGKETYSMEENYETDDGEMKKQYVYDGPTPEESYLQKEMAEDVQGAINQLSPDHKTLVILRDVQGFSYAEIAEIVDCSLGTVKSRISRARLQLKNIMMQNRELLRERHRLITRKEGGR